MDYIASERDQHFVLFEYLGIDKLCEHEKWKDFDADTFKLTLGEAIKFATGVTGPLYEAADKEGARWEAGKVTTPAGIKQAYDQYRENGWVGIAANPELGGQGFPLSMAIACGEAFTAAHCAFQFTPELTAAAAGVIEDFGEPKLRDLFCERMFSGEWAGTMCLTEPGAGSAVGDTKTKAKPLGDGTWAIEGNKIFITSGDHDLADNIVHLVLARTPGAPSGIKGISLFVVPKVWVEPDGSLGASNDVQCTGIEHKMGIHASPTAALAFGENGGCRGFLVGEEHKGIVFMFKMMNHARIAVGLQGCALGAISYELARKYAKERIQGTDILQMRDPDAPRVPIVAHPDVRRMLLTMKAYVEGSRALLYSTAHFHDMYVATGDEGWENLVELLTPICKAYCSDTGFRVTELAIQVHGGYGYCSEYIVEQLCRDVKIASIYEGTNGIQALDLVGRKLGAKGGAVLMSYLNRINTFVARNKGHEALGPLVVDLEKAKNELVKTTMAFRTKGAKNPYLPVAYATPYLEMFGEVVFGHLLLDMALLAHSKLEALYVAKGAETAEARKALDADHPEATFYSGKVQAARFFVKHVLPAVQAKATTMASDDLSMLDVQL